MTICHSRTPILPSAEATGSDSCMPCRAGTASSNLESRGVQGETGLAMRRIVANVVAAALLTGVLMAPSVAVALPAPPADGQKVDLGPDLWDVNTWVPYDYPVGSGTWYVDGVLANWSSQTYSSGVTVLDPHTTVQYWNTAGDTVIGYETFSVGIGVMPACPADGGYYFFHHQLNVPAGADPSLTRAAPEVLASDPSYPKYHYGTAASTAIPSMPLWHTWGVVDTTTLGSGRTRMKLTVRNDTAGFIGPLTVSGAEKYQFAGGDYPLDAFEITALDSGKAARLGPGESTTFSAYGLRPTPTSTVRLSPFSWVTVAAPLPNANVWRFYNRVTGTHFYTADPAEKANVIATLSAIYDSEGPAYSVHEASAANDTALHRFYNRKTGTHFYTADFAEKTLVENTMASTYTYEGVAYYVSDTAPAGATTVWRFYNMKTGTHFYTADPLEKANVEATLSSTYHLDGASFYLAP